MAAGLDGIGREILVSLLATLVASGLIYIFRARITLFLKRLFHFLFDTKVQVDLSRVDRYAGSPRDELDMQFFQKLKSQHDEISFSGLSDSRLSINHPKIPVPLDIRLETEPASQSLHGKDARYEVRVETASPMMFGFRSDNSLREFERLSNDISAQFHDFFENSPEVVFANGTLYTQVPLARDEVQDEELGMRAKLRDSSLEFQFDDPSYIAQGIRKYFRPL